MCGLAHIYLDVKLAELAKEWVVLILLENFAAVTSPIKSVARKTVLPVLSTYGDFLAGELGIKPLPDAISGSLKELQRASPQTELHLFPKQATELPIRAEGDPGSVISANKIEVPPNKWLGEDERQGPLRDLGEYVATINDKINRFNEIIENLSRWSTFGVRDDIYPTIPKLEIFGGPTEHEQNPSHRSLPKFDWESERISQWVRGSYPYVDAFRGSVRAQLQETGWFEPGAPSSHASTYYTRWSNRYTLAESFQLRSGQRDGGAAPSVHMYVLQASSPPTKGKEPWTTQDEWAERLFSVSSYAVLRSPDPAIFKPIFDRSPERDFVAASQALTYDANGRALTGDDRLQPNTGWDTLNWEPPVKAPEWGDHPPSDGGGMAIWDFYLGKRLDAPEVSRVQLNWQAKLVPISARRVNEAATSSGLPEAIRTSAERLREHVPLLTH